MIGTINIKVSASRPNMPLGPFHVFAGSAASFTIVDIPLPLGVRKVTGVTLAAKNVAGVTTGFAAVRVGSAWGVTVPPSHFAASGSVERGVSILATGVDDAGDAVTPWKLGAGDVYVMEPDGSVAPGETVHDLHWHDVRPANPVGGDVAPYDGAVWYFNGTEWIRWASTGDVSHDDFDGIDELASADSIGKVKETVNMVIRKLKGSAVAVVAAALCWSVYADALGPSTILDDVPGTNTIGDIVRAGGGGGGVGAVASVNGKTGTVELVAADVGAADESHVDNVYNPHGVTAHQAFSAGPSVSGDAYFNGSTYFGDTGSAFFDSVPTFRGEFDESTLRTAHGGLRFAVMTPASSRMASTGIVHTPESTSSANLYDVFLKFPHKSGVFALLSDVPSVSEWALSTNKPTYTASEVGAVAKGDNAGVSFSLVPSPRLMGGSYTTFESTGVSHGPRGGGDSIEPDYQAWDWLKFTTFGLGTWIHDNFAGSEDLEPLSLDISRAYQYSRTVALYMTGNTNAWFAGTNYVFGADAASRTHFSWEQGMDASTVPCSMALWEIRDGVRQCVWDQRDWSTWYWSFKAQQMRDEIAATNRLLYAAIDEAVTNDSNHAWAKRYASTGRLNPDASTTFIDTPSVTLSPGMSWETVATVGGCGYWTIVGNGAVIGGSGTNATLNIKDFEGNSILEITKGQHMLAWLDSSDFVGQLTDEQHWVCFDMMADVKPTGYFSTTLVASDFVAETDEDCPAQYRWEDLGGHVWRVHFLLKPGIVSNACFAKFQVEIEGKTQIRYNADTVISGGLIFDGVKIAPVIQSGAAVGSTVTWKVVQ